MPSVQPVQSVIIVSTLRLDKKLDTKHNSPLPKSIADIQVAVGLRFAIIFCARRLTPLGLDYYYYNY